MNALILVDLQYDFLPGGALAVHGGEEVIPIAGALQPMFDLVVATQDCHPADHLSFASQHPGRSVGDLIDLSGLPQVLWPDHCVAGTRGAELSQSLDRHKIDQVFPKGTDREIDSYSGFFDNGQKRSTGLGEYLTSQNVDHVYVLGLATDYCVKATVFDARRLGFTTTLIADACRGVGLSPTDIDDAIEAMRSAGAFVTDSHSPFAR